MTSVLAVVNNLPGVLINEGDVFGGDDWSTTVSIRGFQLSLDEQQVGITVDGIPNGNSNYGGGAKANRYIDSPNLGGVLVSQGTADIASRSNEALGGTLNFLTQDPLHEQRIRVSATMGEYDSRKFYGRYDTGTVMANTQAWISVSTADNKVWIDESGEAGRDHLAAKVVSQLDRVRLTGYVSWDDVHEDNYQRITLDQFAENPDWDRLTGAWTGVPHIDQAYRRAGPEFDRDCFSADAIPLGSYRHTHYRKRRLGLTADFSWTEDVGRFTNTLREGLWYEDYLREEFRDWHRVIDSSAGFRFDDVAYWRQYDRDYPVDIFMYYLEDTVEAGFVTARVGIRQFLVDLERQDNFRGGNITAVANSDSDILISGGLALRTPVEGLELFAGYAENFAAIKDEVLEREASTLTRIQPETANNIDVGVRYEGDRVSGSFTWYTIDFENRVTFIAPGSPAGIDFLIGTNGAYLNVGGVESDGVEVSLSYRVTNFISAYLSYTNNEAKYLGSGDSDLDDSLGVTPGNTVFGSAEEMFVVSADWDNGLCYAGISSKWVGARWLDADNTGRIDSYLVTDLSLGVNGGSVTDWLNGIDLRLIVNNLTDERYIGGVAGGWGGWIGGARTAALTLTADF